MKPRHMFIYLLIIGLLATACTALPTPGASTPQPVTPTQAATGKALPTVPAGTVVPQAPAAASKAAGLLAKELNLDVSQVRLVSSEAVEWPDACLGITEPGQMCAQVITPGYRITLEAQGQRYTYHTNQDGSVARQAKGLVTTPGDILLEWSGKGANCQSGKFSAAEVTYGPCTGTQQKGSLQAQRSQELAFLVSTYKSFQVVTTLGSVSFNGEGTQVATPEEQRSIAEWARLATDEAQAGKANAAAGLALSWHREGGIAGFCDDLAVYVTGFAYPSSCKGGGGSFGFVRLTAEQLKQVYAWYDSLKTFEQTQTDQATADAMTQKLVFNGAGSTTATPAELQAMLALAGEVFASAGTPLAPTAATPASVPAATPLVEGRVILTRFFQHLAAGNYAEAVNLYGGAYDVLADQNPTINAQDHARLFEQACKINGYQCGLTVKDVVQEQQISPTEFHYKITFANTDGSLFTRGPCCGASPTDQPPVSDFDYTVVKSAAGYAVQELPVYVP